VGLRLAGTSPRRYRAYDERVAVGIVENLLIPVADHVNRCSQGHQPLYLVVEMMTRGRQDEVLTMWSGPWIDALAAPAELCSTGGGLDGSFLSLIPDEGPSEYLTPEQSNGSRAIARHFRQWAASGEVGVPVFDDTELVPDHVGHGGKAVLRNVTVAAQPRPQFHARCDGVHLIPGPVSEMNVKSVVLFTVRRASRKPETHLS